MPKDAAITQETVEPSLAGSPQLWIEAHKKVARLSKRELQVLLLLAQGATPKQASIIMDISPRTVEIHCRNMRIKLGAKTISESVRTAIYASLADRFCGDSLTTAFRGPPVNEVIQASQEQGR